MAMRLSEPDEGGKRVLELLRAAQASVQLVDRYLNSHGYWHQCVSLPQARASIHGLRDRSSSPERSPKRRRLEEGESSERVVEAIKLVHTAKVSLQLVERYLESVPVCRHTLVTRRLPTGLRDNGEFVTECARCGKLL